jgi:hypothetical protein
VPHAASAAALRAVPPAHLLIHHQHDRWQRFHNAPSRSAWRSSDAGLTRWLTRRTPRASGIPPHSLTIASSAVTSPHELMMSSKSHMLLAYCRTTVPTGVSLRRCRDAHAPTFRTRAWSNGPRYTQYGLCDCAPLCGRRALVRSRPHQCAVLRSNCVSQRLWCVSHGCFSPAVGSLMRSSAQRLSWYRSGPVPTERMLLESAAKRSLVFLPCKSLSLSLSLSLSRDPNLTIF